MLVNPDRLICFLVIVICCCLPSVTLFAADKVHPSIEVLKDDAPPWFDKDKGTWKRMEIPKSELKEAEEGSNGESDKANSEHKRSRDSEGATGSSRSGSAGPAIGSAAEAAGSGLAGMILFCLLGILVALLAYGIFLLFSREKGDDADFDGDIDTSKAKVKVNLKHLPMGLGQETSDPASALKTALAKGDYNQVVIWSYATAVLKLSQNGIIRLRPGMTNRMCLRALPAGRDTFYYLMTMSERVYFGGEDASAEEAQQAQLHLDTLVRFAKGELSAEQLGDNAAQGNRLALAGHLTGVLLIGLLCLTGCGGGELSANYGQLDAGSVNGLHVFHSMLEDRVDLSISGGLSEQLYERDAAVHFSRKPGLPTEEEIDYINDWLFEGERRTFVLVLRGNSITHELYGQWAEQCQANQQEHEIGSPESQHLAKAWWYFLEKADEALQQDRAFQVSGDNPSLELTLEPVKRISKPTLSGSASMKFYSMPSMVGSSSADLIPHEESGWETWCRMEGRPYVMVDTFHNDSQFMVVQNATLLVDGAAPDPAAQVFMDGLLAHMAARSGKWKMLSTLNLWDGKVATNDIARMLLFTWPINFLIGHLLFVALLFAGYRSLWLGRRVDPGLSTALQRPPFRRHIETLAVWLAQARGHKEAMKALTDYHGWSSEPHIRESGDLDSCIDYCNRQTVRHDYPSKTLSNDTPSDK